MIELLLHYKYFIVIPLTIFEGPLVMLISGFLLHMGYFTLIPIYLCLMAGDFIGDIFWYAIGYYLGIPFLRKYGKYFSITEEGVELIKRVFHKHKNKILIISKLTMGLGFALVTLFTAGLVKIPFRRYAILNFIGEFFWTGILLSLGYYLGKAYTSVNSILGKFFVLAMIIVIFVAILGFAKYIKERVGKAYSS